MKEMILLMGSNLRRAKGQMISIGVLVLFASVMLNLWLMLSTDYKQNFEREHDRLHAGHVTLAVDDGSGEMREFLIEIKGQSYGRTVPDARYAYGRTVFA